MAPLRTSTPCSTSARTISSMKKVLPSVVSMIIGISVGMRPRSPAVETTRFGLDVVRPATVVVLAGDLAIALQQLDPRRPGRGFAGRDRIRRQPFAAARDSGLELVQKTRLARARL